MTSPTSWNVVEYGARSDGKTNDAAAFQRAIDACAKAGGGRVLVPAGRFLCGPFNLESNVEFHLIPGAVVAAIPDPGCYPASELPSVAPDGSRWISALGANNIAITGQGCLDGRGVEFMAEELPAIYKPRPGRPFLLHLENCRKVNLSGLCVRDAPFWAIHLAGCEDIEITGIRVLNNMKVPNSDGIDLDNCRNARISDCHVEGGDDCICLKSEKEYADYGPCEDIVVSGCTLQSASCALKIGTGTHGSIRNVVFDNCIIRSSHRGLGVVLRDGGCVSDVAFSNMIVETRYFDPVWWGSAEPIYVTAVPRQAGAPLGSIQGIRFENILCNSENGVLVCGCAASLPSAISFRNVRLTLVEPGPRRGGYYDLRPCAETPVLQHPAVGFLLRNAGKVSLDNCSVARSGAHRSDYRRAFDAFQVSELLVNDFNP